MTANYIIEESGSIGDLLDEIFGEPAPIKWREVKW